MKMYECPKCRGMFSSLSWDKSTMKELNIKNYWDNYGKIDDERKMGCYYICPGCGEEIEGITIREVF